MGRFQFNVSAIVACVSITPFFLTQKKRRNNFLECPMNQNYVFNYLLNLKLGKKGSSTNVRLIDTTSYFNL